MIIYYFFDAEFLLTQNYSLYDNSSHFRLSCYFIFLGFGVKIPLWPFHFWLTKTHVEASTAFSIFLSGILVKTAVLGLVKFKFVFTVLNQYFMFFILGYGVVDASFKLFSQVDLKKLIAYTTVQEMSIMVFLVIFDSFFSRLILIYFCFFHTAISGLFFYINDSIYKRFGTRHISSISGLISTNPTLASLVILSVFLFIGLPFTIKFYIELQILYKLIFSNKLFSYIFIFVVQYLSILFFFKHLVSMTLGPIAVVTRPDLTIKEISVFSFFISIILILSVV